MFAIEKIDERKGTIEVTQVHRRPDESGGNEEKIIRMVNCQDLKQADGKYESVNSNFDLDTYLAGKPNSEFLCPKDLDELILQGDFGDDFFSFFRIRVKGCDKDDCLPTENVSGTYINLVILKAFANLLSPSSDEIITYVQDTSNFYVLDYEKRQ